MKLSNTVKKMYDYAEYKTEDLFMAGMKKLFREMYGDTSYVGVVGVGKNKEGYYTRGPWEFFIPIDRENPGAHIRFQTKAAADLMLPKFPTEEGHPHRIILVTLPSFLLNTKLSDKVEFFKDWTEDIVMDDSIWCRLRVWR